MTTTSKSSPRPAVAGRTAHEQNDPGEMRSRFTSNATAVHWSSGVIESRDPNAGEGGRGFLPGSAFAPNHAFRRASFGSSWRSAAPTTIAPLVEFFKMRRAFAVRATTARPRTDVFALANDGA